MYLIFHKMKCVESQSVWQQIDLAATDAHKFALHSDENRRDIFNICPSCGGSTQRGKKINSKAQ